MGRRDDKGRRIDEIADVVEHHIEDGNLEAAAAIVLDNQDSFARRKIEAAMALAESVANFKNSFVGADDPADESPRY